MKKAINILIVLLFILAGMGGCRQSGSQGDLITVDLTASYPTKELILQDFMDVEYIPLETNDEFVCEGQVLAIGKNSIIVKNNNEDGDIFLFDRKGKALRIINRKGQGGEEYIFFLGLVLDEDNEEIFVNDLYKNKIIVYDLEGNFKRSLPHKEGILYCEMYSLDKQNLICRDGLDENTGGLILKNVGQSFFVISKQDGSVVKEIQIPFKEKKSIVMKIRDEENNFTYIHKPPSFHPIIPNFGSYAIIEISADTIYSYSPDHIMKPLIARTPSIQSMNPEQFFLLNVLTDRYYFMESLKKDNGFNSTDLLYDKQEKALFRYTVYNGDFTNKEKVYMKSIPMSSEIPSIFIFEAYELIEDLEEGKLKGKLKEIAAGLDEDSNPVIMLMKNKK